MTRVRAPIGPSQLAPGPSPSPAARPAPTPTPPQAQAAGWTPSGKTFTAETLSRPADCVTVMNFSRDTRLLRVAYLRYVRASDLGTPLGRIPASNYAIDLLQRRFGSTSEARPRLDQSVMDPSLVRTLLASRRHERSPSLLSAAVLKFDELAASGQLHRWSGAVKADVSRVDPRDPSRVVTMSPAQQAELAATIEAYFREERLTPTREQARALALLASGRA